jgi:hypothetical protein
MLEMIQMDSLMERIVNSTGGKLATMAAGKVLPSPVTNAILDTVTTAPSDKLLSAGKVLSSQEFANMVKATAKTGSEKETQSAIRRLALSKQFADYAKKINLPKGLTSREQFIITAMQPESAERAEQ